MGIRNEQIERIEVRSNDTPCYLELRVRTTGGAECDVYGKTANAIVNGVVYCDGEPIRKRALVAIFARAHAVPIRYREGEVIPVPGMEEIQEIYDRYAIGTWEGQDGCPWVYAKGQLDGWKD